MLLFLFFAFFLLCFHHSQFYFFATRLRVTFAVRRTLDSLRFNTLSLRSIFETSFFKAFIAFSCLVIFALNKPLLAIFFILTLRFLGAFF